MPHVRILHWASAATNCLRRLYYCMFKTIDLIMMPKRSSSLAYLRSVRALIILTGFAACSSQAQPLTAPKALHPVGTVIDWDRQIRFQEVVGVADYRFRFTSPDIRSCVPPNDPNSLTIGTSGGVYELTFSTKSTVATSLVVCASGICTISNRPSPGYYRPVDPARGNDTCVRNDYTYLYEIFAPDGSSSGEVSWQPLRSVYPY